MVRILGAHPVLPERGQIAIIPKKWVFWGINDTLVTDMSESRLTYVNDTGVIRLSTGKGCPKKVTATQ